MAKETLHLKDETDESLVDKIRATLETLNALNAEALSREISVEIATVVKINGAVSVPVFSLKGAFKQLVKRLIYTL